MYHYMELYKDLQRVSLENYIKRNETRKEMSIERDKRLAVAVEELCNFIKSNAKEKMIQASERGYFSCRIFECASDEKFNDEYRTVFLLRGPTRWIHPVSFMEMKKIKTVDQCLSDCFNPVEISIGYNRTNKTHYVLASWKND